MFLAPVLRSGCYCREYHARAAGSLCAAGVGTGYFLRLRIRRYPGIFCGLGYHGGQQHFSVLGTVLQLRADHPVRLCHNRQGCVHHGGGRECIHHAGGADFLLLLDSLLSKIYRGIPDEIRRCGEDRPEEQQAHGEADFLDGDSADHRIRHFRRNCFYRYGNREQLHSDCV